MCCPTYIYIYEIMIKKGQAELIGVFLANHSKHRQKEKQQRLCYPSGQKMQEAKLLLIGVNMIIMHNT